MVYLHLYRLSQPGRLCSGDYLTPEQLADNSIVDKYLYERGEFFQTYITVFWICVAATGVATGIIAKLMIDAVL